jgi:hypothetical protein
MNALVQFRVLWPRCDGGDVVFQLATNPSSRHPGDGRDPGYERLVGKLVGCVAWAPAFAGATKQWFVAAE